MVDSILWLHEKALKNWHDEIDILDDNIRIIYIWDDGYYQRKGYSLKRLVFIYETLCAMKVDIIKGDTITIFQSLSANKIYIPYSADSEIKKLSDNISKITDIEIIKEVDFVNMANDISLKRFFQYWNKAKKSAFSMHGRDNG